MTTPLDALFAFSLAVCLNLMVLDLFWQLFYQLLKDI